MFPGSGRSRDCLGSIFIKSLVVFYMSEGGVDDDFASLDDFSPDDHLIEYVVHFVEVEHEIQLAHIPEVLVQHLHEQMDEL